MPLRLFAYDVIPSAAVIGSSVQANQIPMQIICERKVSVHILWILLKISRSYYALVSSNFRFTIESIICTMKKCRETQRHLHIELHTWARFLYSDIWLGKFFDLHIYINLLFIGYTSVWSSKLCGQIVECYWDYFVKLHLYDQDFYIKYYIIEF